MIAQRANDRTPRPAAACLSRHPLLLDDRTSFPRLSLQDFVQTYFPLHGLDPLKASSKACVLMHAVAHHSRPDPLRKDCWHQQHSCLAARDRCRTSSSGGTCWCLSRVPSIRQMRRMSRWRAGRIAPSRLLVRPAQARPGKAMGLCSWSAVAASSARQMALHRCRSPHSAASCPRSHVHRALC